ncbi:hypothetical protein B0G71_1445 [Paraburkholderia sp. BL27I4N3]|uniref:hypothetical protein n=1 Tax=Paraburkholderia sp. BL27I4N3 TaxID=1938805 RepID=UPI000E289DF6|nr:hypothetical protein [Paraburkholderia sp. BL27I4N3]REE18429.1 hypothetical protein B0G71_1445 [Paraburkholderia sp. BL27I4N3]
MSMPTANLSDTPNRKVLYAVELWDALTLTRVTRGVKVAAAGLRNAPIVSLSGRFVWFEENEAWPDHITVTLLPGAPYAPVPPVATLPRPANLEVPHVAERLQSLVLQPDATYPLGDGVTCLRGRLTTDTKLDKPPPVAGARVQLAWSDADEEKWKPDAPPADAGSAALAALPVTTASGDFVAFIPRASAPTSNTAADGTFPARLVFLIGQAPASRLVTPKDFQFVDDAGGAPRQPVVPKGHLPEGRALPQTLIIGLTQLAKL